MESSSDALAQVAQDGRVAAPAAQEDKDGDAEPEIGPQPAQHRIKEEGEVSLDHVTGQIELLEHANGGYMGPGEGSGIVADDVQEWITDSDHDLKRVKASPDTLELLYRSSNFTIFRANLPSFRSTSWLEPDGSTRAPLSVLVSSLKKQTRLC